MNRIINSSWKAAGIVVLVLAIWMLSGLFTTDSSSDADTTGSVQKQPVTVEVTVAESTLMERELDLQGQIDPIRHVLIRAQTSGEVQQIIKNKGARVGEGDALVKLDEGGRKNTLAEAQAAVKTARSEQRAAQSMQRQRLQSQLQLEQADAVLEAARARLAMTELDISHTTITAPFPGVVNALPVELGAFVERGDVIVELVDDTAFKMSARVSQHALSQLVNGQPVTVTLITGETLSGVLSFIASVADPQTRSFPVEALVQNTSNAVAAGVSATLSIPFQEVEATFITPSALSLGKDGELGVKALDDQDRVLFLPVELVSTALDGAWVTGIPPATRVITLGQGFVNSGEQVKAQMALN
ncbi:MAG: efflux RND transporter periplasmic adaptor subunit [Granulosicoccus sp.]